MVRKREIVLIDPLLSLSLSLNSNKGIYAILLGSGISNAAGIPTGWEIVIDIIKKVAKLHGEDCAADPESWYLSKYGTAANYSILLNEVAKSPGERRNLLSTYFVPSDEERSVNLKTSTKAHRAIASLVLSGHIKVILTTNFDSLMEDALREKGISPTIISTVDSIQGTLPIIHTSCTVIKLHGDYRDIRIKNTLDELQTYEEPMNTLIDRIFDEFGLIICGWSAEWDHALVSAIERCKSRRFTIYWCTRGIPQGNAKRLIDLRQAEPITIKDADSFFENVQDKVVTLEELNNPHPLSKKTAVASLKRYLPDPTQRIRFHDLVMGETEQLAESITDKHFSVDVRPVNKDEFLQRVKAYESLSETLRSIFATGCYWGLDEQNYVWVKSLTRLANNWDIHGGITALLDLRLYPVVLVMYAGGIAAVAREKYMFVRELLTETKVSRSGCTYAGVFYLDPMSCFKETYKFLPCVSQYTPVNQYIYKLLRTDLREILPFEQDFERAFDIFEYLAALLFLDQKVKDPKYREWEVSPYGSYAWKGYGGSNNVLDFVSKGRSLGENWTVLKQSLFGGSMDRFEQLNEIHTKFLKECILPFPTDLINKG